MAASAVLGGSSSTWEAGKGQTRLWTVPLGSCILLSCPMSPFGSAVLQSTAFALTLQVCISSPILSSYPI